MQELVEPHDAFATDEVLAEGIARYESATTHEVDHVLHSWAGTCCLPFILV